MIVFCIRVELHPRSVEEEVIYDSYEVERYHELMSEWRGKSYMTKNEECAFPVNHFFFTSFGTDLTELESYQWAQDKAKGVKRGKNRV